MHLRFAFIPVFIALGSINAHGQLNPLAENAGARVVFERALSAESRAEWEVLIGLGIKAGGYGASDASAISRMMLVRWLTERWIAEAGAPDRQALVNAISQGNRRYLYVYNASDDTYSRDSAGDLKIRGIAGYKGPGGDKEAWLEDVGTAKEAALASWRKRTKAVYLELLASEGIDEGGEIAKAFSASIAEYEAGVERDFHELTVRHELRLSHLRLRDTLSARRKGESQSAGEVADKLVGAARKSLQASTESLEASIPESEDAAAIKVNAEDWQESFRRQFETGLEAWSNAEDRFVAERLKWETDAQAAYRAAEQEWDEAFTKFGEAREAWLARMNSILVTAQTSWRETLKNFSRDVQSEMTNLSRAQAKEQAARRDEAQTHLAAFKQAAEVLSMAEESITYLTERRTNLQEAITKAVEDIEGLRRPEYEAQEWVKHYTAEVAKIQKQINDLDKPGGNKGGVNNSSTVSVPYSNSKKIGTVLTPKQSLRNRLWFMNVRLADARKRKTRAVDSAKAEIDALRGKIESRKSDLAVVVRELGYWQGSDGNGGIRKQFTGIRNQARDKITAFAARISGGLEGTGSIDKERHRLKELINMLKDEESIARAVVRYADDNSSDRDTRAETAEKLIDAVTSMRRAQKAYQDALKELERLSSEDIAVKQGALNEQQGKLSDQHRQLSDAKQILQNALDAYHLDETGVFDRLLKKIDQSNETFLDTKTQENKNDYKDLLSAYAKSSWKAVPAEMIANIRALELRLEKGKSIGNFISTADLKNYKDKLKSINIAGEPVRSAAQFKTYLLGTVKLEPDDPNLNLLHTAYRAFHGAEDENSRKAARLELKAIHDKLVADAESRILVRDKQLALLKGLYTQKGTPNAEGEAPVVLEIPNAEQLETQIKLQAAKAALEYRRELLSLQDKMNTALKKFAAAEAAWEKLKKDGKPAGTLSDALNNAHNKNSDVEVMALMLYRNGKRALTKDAIVKIKSAYSHLTAADKSSEASIRQAMAHKKVTQAQAYAEQFNTKFGNANLLDIPAAEKRRANAAAGGELEALESRYGRAGYSWLQVNLQERIQKIKAAIDAFTRNIDTRITPELFAAAYVSLTQAGAPDAILDTIGLYARALAAEGRLTALSPDAINAMDNSSPRAANLARAHRRLAEYLAAPSSEVTLAHLAGRDLPHGAIQPNALKSAVYREMLKDAADSVKLHSKFRTNGDLAAYKDDAQHMRSVRKKLRKLRGAFMGAESRYRDNLAQRVTMSVQRKRLLDQKAAFYDQTITGLQNKVGELKRAVEQQESRVGRALREFTAAAERYKNQGVTVAAAEETYQSARLALRTAEAVDDYARSGSVEASPNPREAFRSAGEKLTAARTALGVITGLINKKQAEPRRDARYQALLDTEKNQLQASQEIALTAKKLAEEMSSLEAKIKSTRQNIVGMIRERGKFKDKSDWFPGDLDLAEIKADRIRGRSAEFSNYNEYFKGDDARKYTTDLGSWILGITERGGTEFMRQMSVALMYELYMADGYQKYTEHIRTMSTLTGSKDSSFDIIGRNPYGKFAISTPVELRSYDLNPFKDSSGRIKQHLRPHMLDSTPAARLIEVSKERALGIFVTRKHTKGAAENNLHSRAAGTYDALKGKPEYEFFRLLIASGNHTALLQRIVNDDIQNHAAASLSQDGWQYYGRLPWRWYHNERGDIRRAIGALPKTTGAPERDRFLAKDQMTNEMESWRTEVKKRKELSETAPTLASVQAQIKRNGGSINGQLTAAIEYVLRNGSKGDLKGIVSAVDAVSDRISRMLSDTHNGLTERAGKLTERADSSETAYLRILGRFLQGRADRSELTAAAEARYRNPAYDAADALAARIKNVRDVKTRTTQGELMQLQTLVNRILESGAHKDADFQRRLMHGYTMDKEQLERSINHSKEAALNLITLAKTEWARSYNRLEDQRRRWRREIMERYDKNSELWDLRHAQLAAGREEWLKESTRSGMEAGTRAVAAQWDLEAGALIAEAESAVIPSFQGYTPNLSALVDRAVGGSLLNNLIERAEELQNRSRNMKMVVAAYLPIISTHAAKAGAARSIAQGIFDQVTERAAVLTAVRAREQFERQLDAMDSGIKEANQSMDDRLTNRMEGAGYSRYGALWRRRSIVGSTVLGGNEWEDHEVAVYQNFVDPGFQSRIDLSNEALKGLSGRAIFTMVEEAGEEMARYQVLIFGRSEKQREQKTKEGKENKKYVKPADVQEFRAAVAKVMEQAEKSWKNSAGASRNTDTEGLFNFHVGYQPVMDGENIKEAGYGQLGIIMGQFMRNEGRMNRGHVALMTPAYRKPMWDDDADNDGKSDGIIAAPSLATVVDIAANIVIAAVLPGGAGNMLLAAALNLVDDFIFATADVATGYASVEDSFGALGKKALSSMVSAGISIGGSALDGVMGVAGTFGEVASDIGIKATQMVTTNAANSIIYNGFNGDKLLEATFGTQALRSYAVSLTNTAVSSTMETAITGNVGDKLNNARALSSLTGGVTAAALEYGLTGSTRLNVLNMADLTGGKLHGGLLELKIGGERSSLLNVGQGGLGVNAHALKKAAAGFDVYKTAVGIHRRGFRGDEAVAMRMLSSMENDETNLLFDNLMSGKAALARRGSLEARAETQVGADGRKTIILGKEASGEGRFGLGLTLVHEAFRDGEIGDADQQSKETQRAVLGHVDAAQQVMNGYGKRAVGAAQRQEIEIIRTLQYLGADDAVAEYVGGKYDSSADYWKAVMDEKGKITLHNDGRGDVYLQLEGSDKEIKIGSFDSKDGKLEHLAGLFGNDVSPSDILQMMLAQSFDSGMDGSKYHGGAEPVSIALDLEQSARLLNNIAGDDRVDWSKYAGVKGSGSFGGQNWNTFQQAVDGHTMDVLDWSNFKMDTLNGDYWKEVALFGVINEMNSNTLGRVQAIGNFIGKERNRLFANGSAGDGLINRYSELLEQTYTTSQSVKNLHTLWKFEGRTANVKDYQIRSTISTGLDFIPVVNDIKGILETFTGRRMVSGEKLSTAERIVTGGTTAVGLTFDAAQWTRAAGRLAGGTMRSMLRNAQRHLGKNAVKSIAGNFDEMAELALRGGTGRLAKIGWKVGDPITNLTRKGNIPSWSTVRRRYWRNEAHNYVPGKGPIDWTETQLARMQKGLAPQQINEITGLLESMELHHVPAQRYGNLFDFIPLWPADHALVDTYRRLGR